MNIDLKESNMQYILSEQEYNDLLNKSKNREKELLDTLQDLCTKVCDNMPVLIPWDNKERVWGCILTKKNGYCDRWAVANVCPNLYKSWSK